MYHPNELDQQIENLRTLQQSFDQIGTAAEAYNVGKTQLAAAITSKGVETSPTETYPEMAEKVNAISQETYEINGGEMYAKQLFGSLETPNYWNLYEVLAQLLSDGRLVNYGGILLAEYYRGYDSLALAGAGAGGAYVVSDKDENGQFKMYTEDTTHVWATEFDGKGNRWVAYCFADEYHDFQITDTNTSPRSIFIGRKVGTIKCLANTRTESINIPDGNELRCFNPNGFNSLWNKTTIVRNITDQISPLIKASTYPQKIYAEVTKLSNALLNVGTTDNEISEVILKCKELGAGSAIFGANSVTNNVQEIIVDGVESCYKGSLNNYFRLAKNLNSYSGSTAINLKKVLFTNTEELYFYHYCSVSSPNPNWHYIYIGYKTNDKNKSVVISQILGDGSLDSVNDIELRDGWCKPFSVIALNTLTEENMYAHILQRLKQDEPDCGDGVTITLGSTNLAKLTSEESVQLLDDLTNIYGYTFA